MVRQGLPEVGRVATLQASGTNLPHRPGDALIELDLRSWLSRLQRARAYAQSRALI
jgi:hypothetical protein